LFVARWPDRSRPKTWPGEQFAGTTEKHPTFLPGGIYKNSLHGSGTWKVTSNGLEIHSGTFGGIFQAEMRDDGTILDATYNVAGKICKK
jgi:hypothetical protein